MRDEPGGGPTPDIYSISVDGSEALLIRGPAYDPDWSPDGRRIAYMGLGNHWGGPIVVARSDGGGMTQLTGQDPDMEDAWPAWSPDGTRLAFTRLELSPTGGSTRIWLMSADGSGAHPVSANGAYMPVWSPDGRTIAFRDWTGQGHVLNADGSGLVTLLPSALVFDDWSADGRFLLFSQGGRGRSDVYLFELDTGTITRLTADGAYNRDAVFWTGPPER
jgi:Tol biopolymer transport system component